MKIITFDIPPQTTFVSGQTSASSDAVRQQKGKSIQTTAIIAGSQSEKFSVTRWESVG